MNALSRCALKAANPCRTFSIKINKRLV
jgi:hypothetical protein